MKKPLLVVLIIPLLIIGASFFINRRSVTNLINPSFKNLEEKKPKPLDKYTIESLAKTKFQGSQITIGDVVKDEPNFASYPFYFYVDGKKVSGLAHFPKQPGTYPIIVMFRGYIDRQTYTTGEGTRRAGQFFAQNGFITLAPDFLGYGESDNPSENPLEERFQTYTAALTLLESIKNLNLELSNKNIAQVKVDSQKLGIWGHSNGGQIALTVLEITAKSYPTVLWAPVSKPFPYSVIYYTDDFNDHGKMLRLVIADFEKDYDAELYSVTNYFADINDNTPVELHQGSDDEAVPINWSNQLNKSLTDLGKDVSYFTYPGDDHNFAKGAWQTVVNRNISFYQKHLNQTP